MSVVDDSHNLPVSPTLFSRSDLAALDPAMIRVLARFPAAVVTSGAVWTYPRPGPDPGDPDPAAGPADPPPLVFSSGGYDGPRNPANLAERRTPGAWWDLPLWATLRGFRS